MSEKVMKDMVIEAKAEESEKKWLEEQKQKAVKDERPGHYRELMVLFQKIHHYYHSHDMDSAALEIDKFNALMEKVKTEMKMSE